MSGRRLPGFSSFDDISATIKTIICEDPLSEFAIYTFGKAGMNTKEILNKRFGRKEKYIIDNGLSSLNPNVYTSDVLKNSDENLYISYRIGTSGEDSRRTIKLGNSGKKNYCE